MRVLSRKLQLKGFKVITFNDSEHLQRYALLRDNIAVAHMKFCSDLDEYYLFTENGFEYEKKYHELSDRLKGQVGVVEVQARKSSAHLRENVPYKDILFRAYQKDTKQKPDFMLSHTQIFYMNKQIRDYLLREDELTLNVTRLKRNYDQFAQSQGYLFDATLGIYTRPH